MLVQRLRARDQSAMTEFYDRYPAALYGVIHRIVKADDESEDVLQEALVKIDGKVRPESAGFGPKSRIEIIRVVFGG